MKLSDHIFKAYDIRGIFEQELHQDIVERIGYCLGRYILEHTAHKDKIKVCTKVCIGYDIRDHSPLLCEWLTNGFNASNIAVYIMGMTATPVNYFANYIESTAFDATVMITASHNPKAYNGLKITIDKAPFFGEQLQRLKADIIASYDSDLTISPNNDHTTIDINRHYIDFITKHFDHLKAMRLPILLDSGNGSVGFLIEEIFQRLSLNYTHLFSTPDGNFPNHHPDPSVRENLEAIYERIKDYAIAFAYDGDGDRLAVLTNKNAIKGDILATIFAKQMDNPTVIAEVKSSSIFYDEVNRIGQAIMCKTGHSHIKEKLQATNATMAAEVSGHLFFNDRYFGYDDAIYATLRVLELLHNGIDLDKEIAKLPTLYVTDELKTAVKEEAKCSIIERIQEHIKSHLDTLPPIKKLITIDGMRIEFEEGWGLIRMSNTTPYLISRFEAKHQEALERYQKSIEQIITQYI